MKILRIIALVPFFAGLLFAGAVAGEYGDYRGSRQYREMMPQEAVPVRPEVRGDAEFYTGTLSGINLDSREIAINTEVPGLLGPQTRSVPFAIDRDTTVTVCFRSINSCDGLAHDESRWRILASLDELESLDKVENSVVVVGDPESDRTVHVNIEYGL